MILKRKWNIFGFFSLCEKATSSDTSCDGREIATSIGFCSLFCAGFTEDYWDQKKKGDKRALSSNTTPENSQVRAVSHSVQPLLNSVMEERKIHFFFFLKGHQALIPLKNGDS